jgi:hypothetical protein
VLGSAVRFGTTWLLTIIATMLFGWVEDVAAKRPVRIIPWPRTPRLADGPPQAAEGGWLAWISLRSRPLLVTGSAALAAALLCRALLWPRIGDHTFRAPAGSLGRPVDPQGNSADSPVRTGPPSSTTERQDQGPTTGGPTGGISAAPPEPTGGLTQQQRSAPTSGSSTTTPARSGAASRPGAPANGQPGPTRARGPRRQLQAPGPRRRSQPARQRPFPPPSRRRRCHRRHGHHPYHRFSPWPAPARQPPTRQRPSPTRPPAHGSRNTQTRPRPSRHRGRVSTSSSSTVAIYGYPARALPAQRNTAFRTCQSPTKQRQGKLDARARFRGEGAVIGHESANH